MMKVFFNCLMVLEMFVQNATRPAVQPPQSYNMQSQPPQQPAPKLPMPALPSAGAIAPPIPQRSSVSSQGAMSPNEERAALGLTADLPSTSPGREPLQRRDSQGKKKTHTHNLIITVLI
jgi:hypothetical protein